jgi:hypothetical protein
MLVLKVPVQLVLGSAAVRFPPLATGVQVCASATFDTPVSRTANSEAAIAPVGAGTSDADATSVRRVACFPRFGVVLSAE